MTNATELTGRTVNWNYDGIYRLTNEAISLAPSNKNGSVSYGLDPVGNRLSEVSSLGGVSSGSWSFNPDDELSSESYDQNGNVTATGGKTFAYDSQNELVTMTTTGTSASIVYDGFGNRVAKTVNGATTRYLVEDDVNPTGYPQVFDELTGGVVTRTYTYGLQRIDEEQVLNGAWTPSFYDYDGGGNVRQLTNSAGTITDSYEYDAYGNEFTVSGTTPNEFMYRGEQFDSDLGLYYLRARYYNPLTGRFMSRDPFAGRKSVPATLHKYLYAGTNPVTYSDPRGLLLEEYAAALNNAEARTRFVAAIGCGVGLAYYVEDVLLLGWEGTLNEMNENPLPPIAVGAACALAFWPGSVEGAPGVALDIIGAIGCAGAAIDADNAANKVIADYADGSSAYTVDAQHFGVNLFAGLLGCAVSGVGAANDFAEDLWF